MNRRLIFLSALFSGMIWAGDPTLAERGQKEETRNCVACHSLRLINSQRLPKAAWGKELDKMAGWGAKIDDRDALLEYLITNFGEDKPLETVMTQNGAQPAAR